MRTQRRLILVPVAIVAAALAAASTAWACTTFDGQTKIDGYINYPNSVSKGGNVPNITGDGVPTGSGWPADGSGWHVKAVEGASSCCYGGSTIATGATLNRANSPDLGPLNGTAPTWTGGSGSRTYQVCYLPNSGDLYATTAAYLTVT